MFAKFNIPNLNVGYLNDISYIGPLTDFNHACPLCGNALRIDCMVENKSEKDRLIEENYSAPSSFVNNAFASAMAMSDILSYIFGDINTVQSFNKRVGIDNRTFKLMELKITKDPLCPFCAQKES